jgi:peptidyl-prolyl cis-trans isomerase SurA
MKKRIFTIGVCLATLLSPVHATEAEPVALDPVLVVVNDNVILRSELNSRMRLILSQFKDARLPPADILKTQILDRLILERIQLDLAEQIGIRSNENDINQTLQAIAEDNQLSLEAFRQSLLDQGIDYGQFRKQVETDTLVNQVQRKLVASRVQVSEQDVQSFLQSADGQAQLTTEYRIGHILIAVKDQADSTEVAKASALAAQIVADLRSSKTTFKAMAATYSTAQNALEGGDLGWRPAAQIPSLFVEPVKRLSANAIADPIKSASGFHIIQLQGMRGGSDKHVDQIQVRHILVKANVLRTADASRQLAQELYARLQKGESFATLANTYSDDPGSARKGGELGWVVPEAMVKSFANAMQTLPINQISSPVESEYGWHLIEVLGRRNQDVSNENRLQQSRNAVFRRQFEEELALWLQEIRQEAYVDVRG